MIDPYEHGWWLASRAAGVVALLCITASVGIGLAMAASLGDRPALRRALMGAHRQTALLGLVAIAVHGITLLGDRYLDPGVAGIGVPFLIERDRIPTGLGVTAGWLGAILGLSYDLRHRIGPALWRRLHKGTVLVYVLSVVHTVGAGTDGREPWMVALLTITGAPVVFLFLLRVLPAPRPGVALKVVDVRPESADVTSLTLAGRLPPARPGQFVTVHAAGTSRCYSLCGAPGQLRLAVRREPGGRVSEHLHTRVAPGDVLRVEGPHGALVLDDDDPRPLVLASAGIGVTPLLAMLHALAARRDAREVWWVHGARDGAHHPFGHEVRALLDRLPRRRHLVAFSRPRTHDTGHDVTGRVTVGLLVEHGVPLDAAFRLCGGGGFVADLTSGLREAGVPAQRIGAESFGGAAGRGAQPAGQPAAVAFGRSGVQARWDGSRSSLLELAEAHDVHAPSGCRAGACGACSARVLAGDVEHAPGASAPHGAALLCCARPVGDVVLDL